MLFQEFLNNLNIFSVRNKIKKNYILMLKRLVYLTGTYSVLSFPSHKKLYFQFKNTLRHNTKYTLNIIKKITILLGREQTSNSSLRGCYCHFKSQNNHSSCPFDCFAAIMKVQGTRLVQTIEYELDLAGKQGISSKLKI